MPHDHSAFDFAAETQPKTGSGILAQMKAAGRSLVARAKHGAAIKVLSATLVAAAAARIAPHHCCGVFYPHKFIRASAYRW